MLSLARRRLMNHCFEICNYQQNVQQHYYLLDTLITCQSKLPSRFASTKKKEKNLTVPYHRHPTEQVITFLPWFLLLRSHGFLASLSADHNAFLSGRASFSADHNALRCEEPCFQRTRMHCALPQFETKKTTTTIEKFYKHTKHKILYIIILFSSFDASSG